MYKAITKFVLAAGAVALVAAASAAQAQGFPTRTITLVNSFAAGGPTDVYLRPLAQKLSEVFGKPVVVEAIVGASGSIAAANVARATPDGHTLLAISNTHAINETLMSTRGYRLLKDFAPVTSLYTSEHAVFVNPGVPAKTLAEFVALAKKDPGKLMFASSGHGSTYHLAGELFKAKAGVDMLHVPYRGSSQARTDLLSGQVQAMFDLVAPMVPQVETGKLRVLATTGAKRSALMPDVPTVIEAGVPGYTAEAWCVLLAPAGTPKDVIERIRTEVLKFMTTPEADMLAKKHGMVSKGSTPEELGKFLADEVERWASIIKAANLKTN
jgi:tripartite-type tricarboxylate transporter receptor subunit TctC